MSRSQEGLGKGMGFTPNDCKYPQQSRLLLQLFETLLYFVYKLRILPYQRPSPKHGLVAVRLPGIRGRRPGLPRGSALKESLLLRLHGSHEIVCSAGGTLGAVTGLRSKKNVGEITPLNINLSSLF